jgi:hypothetical protein
MPSAASALFLISAAAEKQGSRAGLWVSYAAARVICFWRLFSLRPGSAVSALSHPDAPTPAIDRWQTVTDLEITKETLESLSGFCSEFLVHAADVEGLCQGIDEVGEEAGLSTARHRRHRKFKLTVPPHPNDYNRRSLSRYLARHHRFHVAMLEGESHLRTWQR